MENLEFAKHKNPMEYLKIFFRRKWLFIAPVFAGLVLGIVAAFVLPPNYESSTTILVEEERIINPLIENLAVSSTAAQRMENIREIILGWNSLVQLSEKLNLAKKVHTQLQFEELIKGLRESISVLM
ncbi:MAG: Wzz/FepE/Etk N-terminal domain-containing protein, partial [Candidatus Omnitrophica bacterium]|nr:Wzz/FepE/Etk N-terminal domain-containing protein [Candidatus Omnitrophota bacterium]